MSLFTVRKSQKKKKEDKLEELNFLIKKKNPLRDKKQSKNQTQICKNLYQPRIKRSKLEGIKQIINPRSELQKKRKKKP